MAMELMGSLDHLAAGTGETPARLHSWLDVGHFHHNVRETSELKGGSHVPTTSPGQVAGALGGPGSGFRLHQRQGGEQESKWPQVGALPLGEGFQLGLLRAPQHADPEGASRPLAAPSEALGGKSGPYKVEVAVEEGNLGSCRGPGQLGKTGMLREGSRGSNGDLFSGVPAGTCRGRVRQT